MSGIPLGCSPLLGPLFATAPMRECWSDRALLQRMLDIEAALARAEARAGVIPKNAVAPIAASCRAARFDIAALGEAAANAGNIAIPLVKALTADVAKRHPQAARFVHWGATSQDIIDTAAVLGLREAAALLDRDLARAVKAFLSLARKHRRTMLPGRTWMQHALPTLFGLKASGYAAALARGRERIASSITQACLLQFGGAAGTLAALHGKGPAVARALGRELDLPVPPAPWHTQSDRVVAAAAAIGVAIGSCAKIARDISLLMQTEIGEAFEPAAPGRGGSSTMPHKRNPASSAQILAAANLAPPLIASLLSGLDHENERGIGGWQAGWVSLPQLLLLASGAFSRTAELAAGLEIVPARMSENLELTRGQVFAEAAQMALGVRLGRMAAHELVAAASKRASAEGRHLREVLAEIPEVMAALSPYQLAQAFEAKNYLGSARGFLDAEIAGVTVMLGRSGVKKARRDREPARQTKRKSRKRTT
jgi:3-carboxy-cis,cis-muconate cycloisomerase